MRRGVAKSVARVSNTSPDHCRYGIGYLLARSVLYETLAIITAAYPSDVILVNHILSILQVLCIVMLYCSLYSTILLLRNGMSGRSRCRTDNLVCAYSYSINTIVCCPCSSWSPAQSQYLVVIAVEYPPTWAELRCALHERNLVNHI